MNKFKRIKVVLIWLSVCFCTGNVYSQTVEFFDTITIVNGLAQSHHSIAEFKIRNTSDIDTLSFILYRKIVSEIEDSENYFSIGNFDYPPSIDTTVEVIKLAPNEIDSSFFAGYIANDNLGTTTIEYCIYDTSNLNEQKCISVSYVILPAGDVNKNGVIDGDELCGDIDDNGIIDVYEKLGDIGGNGVIDNGERVGDLNGDKLISGQEIYGDSDNDGIPDDYLGTLAPVNNYFEVFPNPSSGTVFIECLGEDLNNSLTVVDELGNLVYQTRMSKGLSKKRLDFSALDNGIYFFSVCESGRVKQVERIIISK